MTDETMTIPTQAQVIAARRQKVRDDAPCEGCGTTLARCKAERGKDPTAPPWFGCCARGLLLDTPCSHHQSPAALQALLDEIEAGRVRTVEEVEIEDATGKGVVHYFSQRKWWRKRDGSVVRIADMSAGHRYNAAAMLMRNNPGARMIIEISALYLALTEGLTITGDGTQPWERTGRGPVTGEPCEVPVPMVRVCPLDDCGCSGEEHE